MSGKGFAAARSWIALTFAVAALMPAPGAAQALRQAADRAGVLIGTAVRPERLSEAAYAATLAREFNLLEPEDALKWEVLRPDPQSFDFSQAVVDFVLRHNMRSEGTRWSGTGRIRHGSRGPVHGRAVLQTARDTAKLGR